MNKWNKKFTKFKSLSSIAEANEELSKLRLPNLIEEIIKDNSYMIIGGNVVGIYTRPRATLDIDLVVDEKIYSEVKKLLDEAIIDYTDNGDAIETDVFDLIKATAHPLINAVFNDRVSKGKFYIPSREGMVALKYYAAISPVRQYERKLLDAADIGSLLEGVDREKVLSYIEILGNDEVKKFKEVLDAYDNKRAIVI